VKKEVFGKLDEYAKPGAVLASNTSYLNIDEIAKSTKRPQDVLAMHFFSPANVNELSRSCAARRPCRDGWSPRCRRRESPRCRPWSRLRRLCRNRMLAHRGKQSEKLLFEVRCRNVSDRTVTKFPPCDGPSR